TGVLAALAHHAVAVDSRLSLYPARRQRGRRGSQRRRADRGHGPRGAVARRELDLRGVGRRLGAGDFVVAHVRSRACADQSSVMAELLFRVIEATPLWRVLPVSEVSLYGPDEDTGYRHRVGAHGVWLQENRSVITISNLGLRDRDRAFERISAFERGNATRA